MVAWSELLTSSLEDVREDFFVVYGGALQPCG
jgi:hypothetical protein